jgi:cyclic pyranopterin monophosphate synthase
MHKTSELMTKKQFSHLDKNGKAQMVDVGTKTPQQRIARARGKILMAPETIELIKKNQIKKGDVLSVAQIAGIQAAKQTPYLIPLCHNLFIEKVAVSFAIEDNTIIATSEVHCTGKTGVEMEALVAVNIALLTIYDMCKAVDKSMRIDDVVLIEKVKVDVE